MKKILISILLISILLYTPKAEAVYFGGSVGQIIGCVNTVIYTTVGPPRGGIYIWSPSVTKTYSFGPPAHSGQWLLGEAGPSYFCIESILPLIVHPGLLMVMLASSQ